MSVFSWTGGFPEFLGAGAQTVTITFAMPAP